MVKYACQRGITALLLLLVAFMTANAQEFRGSITGKVTDPNEAVVPGAEVSIKNIETNAATTAATRWTRARRAPWAGRRATRSRTGCAKPCSGI